MHWTLFNEQYVVCWKVCSALFRIVFFRAGLCSSMNYCDVQGGAIQWDFELGDKFHSTEVSYFKSIPSFNYSYISWWVIQSHPDINNNSSFQFLSKPTINMKGFRIEQEQFCLDCDTYLKLQNSQLEILTVCYQVFHSSRHFRTSGLIL